jgi:small subunit ribosomal protein S20
LANIASARKRARQAIKRRQQNMANRSFARTMIRRVVIAIESGDAAAASAAFVAAVPVIDRMADKGVMHRNKAARHKSRLNARIKALARPAA